MAKRKVRSKGRRRPNTRSVTETRPMSPPPVDQPPQLNDLEVPVRVMNIKRERDAGLHYNCTLEPAQVSDDSLDVWVKSEPSDDETIKEEATHECNEQTCATKDALKKYKVTGLKKDFECVEPAKTAKKHKCPVCDMRFWYKYKVKRHIIKHQEKKFRCGTCQKLFVTKIAQKLHQEWVHDPKTIACENEMCKNRFSSDRLLKRHLRVDHKKDKMKCLFCEQTFISNRDSDNHYRVHIQEKPFSCTTCGKGFASKSARDNDTKNHGMEHKCNVCSRTFASRHNLKRHCGYTHEGKRWSCVFCNVAFSSKANLEGHLVREIKEKPYPCEKCDAEFASSSDRRKHWVGRKRCGKL